MLFASITFFIIVPYGVYNLALDSNIPDGFEVDSSNTLDNMMEPLKKGGAQISSKAYLKDKDAIGLFVVNVTNGLTNEQALKAMG